MGQRASLPQISSIDRVAETREKSTSNVDEEQSTGTEHPRSSTSPSGVEDSCAEVAILSSRNNVEEYPSKDNAEAFRSDSECSDIDLYTGCVTSDELDSDSSINSIQDSKKNKRVCCFLENIAVNPTSENMHETLFYCPVCRGSGLGETCVFKGCIPLLAHSKQYKKRRVKLHRVFAASLEKELQACGILTVESCQVNPFSKQIRLIEDEKLMRMPIVWPPMVVIQLMGVEVEGHHKRVGLRSREILEMFKEYHPRKVIRAYGHGGNSGFLDFVVFQGSLIGYMHAKRLAKNFKLSKRGRMDWHDLGTLKLQPCTDGMLYGYLATEEDMVVFNTCDAGKKKLKWDLKKYQDVVIEPLIQMHEAKLENSGLKEHNKELEKIISKLYAKQKLEDEEDDFARQIAKKTI